MGLGRRKSGETITRSPVSIFVGVVFGFLLGASFPTFSLIAKKMNVPSGLFLSENIFHREEKKAAVVAVAPLNVSSSVKGNGNVTDKNRSPAAAPKLNGTKIWIPTNPRGAEMLAPGIVEAESDFYPRRLWGNPSEDLPNKPKYLVTFTVGYSMKQNIDKAVKKFSQNFTILLFHYDGRTTEWNEFEWAKQAIHVSILRQTKWWYAKRFLHPDIVAAYDYIFIWDEDLGVEHFDAEKYIELVRKHGLEISQPGLDPNQGLTWQMTKRREDRDVHKSAEIKKGWCTDPHLPPCAAFVEIMAPVFSRDAWRCVWYMLQNDLVHGWGLDFSLRRCVDPAHEKIGVVDSQWIVHQTVPSLGKQVKAEKGKLGWEVVRERSNYEWTAFQKRVAIAESEYYRETRGDSFNSTAFLEGRERENKAMNHTHFD